ncbi:MAG: hypothetical protein Q4Q58_02210 [Thermoplasmata archaeon]|nr:hypothetical protein [Thermoplasmata archaeon]
MKTGDKLILTFVVVIVLASCAFYAIGSGILDDDEAVTDGDLTYSGSLAKIGVTGTGSGNVGTLTLTDGSATTQWYILDLTASTYVLSGSVYVERGYEWYSTGQTMTISPGYYGVRVVDGDTSAFGEIALLGTVTQTYSWTQNIGTSIYTYSFDFTYNISSYLTYAMDDSAVRHSSSSLEDSRYAVVDGDIERLEDLLAAEYLEVRGLTATTDQSYADFLLSFVQCCIDYPTSIAQGWDGYYRESDSGSGDLYLYGQSEYWAYPMETIHRGQGDCEDTSFLSAALYSAAGYTAGVVVLPGHMVSLVGLSDFTETYRPGYLATSRTLSATGETIYFCETTTSQYLPVGYLSVQVHNEVLQVTEVSLVGD